MLRRRGLPLVPGHAAAANDSPEVPQAEPRAAKLEPPTRDSARQSVPVQTETQARIGRACSEVRASSPRALAWRRAAKTWSGLGRRRRTSGARRGFLGRSSRDGGRETRRALRRLAGRLPSGSLASGFRRAGAVRGRTGVALPRGRGLPTSKILNFFKVFN